MNISRFVPYYIDKIDKTIVGIKDRATDKRIITIDVSETGEENKSLAKDIISLIELSIEEGKIKVDDPYAD